MRDSFEHLSDQRVAELDHLFLVQCFIDKVNEIGYKYSSIYCNRVA